MRLVPSALLILSLGGIPLAAQDPATSRDPRPESPRFPGGAPRFPFGPPPGMGAERKLVKTYDKDGDKRLNAAERKAAFDDIVAEREQRMKEMAQRWGNFKGRGGRPGGGPGLFPRMGPGGPMRSAEPAKPGKKLTPADVRTYGKEPLYDANTLRTTFLEFEDANWEAHLTAFHNTDVDVPATVTVDGVRYSHVGVSFRGNTSFMMVPEGRKRPLKLSFEDAEPKTNLGGYRTINLLNAHMDPTFMRTVLFMDIARKYLPAPKANFMRVVINGESWGLYVNAQQFNSDFTAEWFTRKQRDRDAIKGKEARWKAPGMPGSHAGLSYHGDDPAAYRKLYEIKTKDTDSSWAALINLCRVLERTKPEKLEAALEPIFDVNHALRYLALENVLINNDGYWSRNSDYNLYKDPSGRFHVIPHDANETFQAMEQRFGGPAGRGPMGPPPFFPGGGGGGFPPGGPDDFRGGPFPGPGGPPMRPPDGFRAGGPGGPGPMGMPRGTRVDLDPLAGIDDPNKPLIHKLLAVPALKQRYLGYVRTIATNDLDWKKHLGPSIARYRALIEQDIKEDTRKLTRTEDFARAIEASEERELSLKTFAEKRREFLLHPPQAAAKPNRH